MATRENFMSPDGVVRQADQISFGHMITALDVPTRGQQYALGESVQATVVRKIWNGMDYVNIDSKEGMDVWNALVTELRDLKASVSGLVSAIKTFETTMQVWTANVKAQVDAIDASLGAPLEERVKVIVKRVSLTPENMPDIDHQQV